MPTHGETEIPSDRLVIHGSSDTDYQGPEPVDVEIRPTHVGRGVFANRSFPIHAVIGEIEGEVLDDPDYSSDYAFDIGDDLSLEPEPPFRFLNHSCEPNCEYVWADEEGVPDIRQARKLYVVALRNISQGEQLTIDYSWEAEAAIPCLCGASNCRQWIVCQEELELISQPKPPKRRRA